MVLTWRPAVLIAFVVVVALVTASPWAYLGVGAAALLILVDMVLCASPAKVEVSRGGDESIRLGETAQVWVLVTNRSSRRLRARIRDSWFPSAGARGGVSVIDIPAGKRRRHSTTLHPTRRGDRPAGPVVLRCMGPLGFAGRQRSLAAPWSVRVLPPFTSRRHLPSRLARLRELDGRTLLQRVGAGTEFDSLREYVYGDDVRSIDWRATARASDVIVRTWRPERDRHVLIVIDSGRTSAGRIEDQPRLDHHYDAALLLATLALKAGDRVDLLIVDTKVRARVARATATEFLSRAVNAMAPVDATLAESDYHEMVKQCLGLVSQRSLVVFFMGLDAGSVTEGLIPAASQVLRKHQVLIASVSDPHIDELRADGDSTQEVFAAAAAEADIASKRAVIAQLVRHKVSVVYSPPESLAPDVTDRYLAMKKAGLL